MHLPILLWYGFYILVWYGTWTGFASVATKADEFIYNRKNVIRIVLCCSFCQDPFNYLCLMSFPPGLEDRSSAIKGQFHSKGTGPFGVRAFSPLFWISPFGVVWWPFRKKNFHERTFILKSLYFCNKVWNGMSWMLSENLRA